ncbi:type IV secretion system protein VirB9 [Palleronia aestuarii]|uniref:Type IV secretion system protein VirB9 n=1 Tax=Palleronia aestuarii TaxID=568105 RepID=A0A2W7NMF5_9RHOB|nr:TrbG/VirB9 family P-type conjugative transfer protein [Palleronia aestuarii]PZX12452.1 type IV secretion system protein VirB9 [Palleronia aestuarii]
MKITISFILGFCFAFVVPMVSHAERAPTTMGQDARVRNVLYAPSDVIRIDTNLLVNTAVELGPGERINQVLLGDSDSFEVQVLSNRNVVSIKPVTARASTNMTIYTARRAIAFQLTEGRSGTPTYRVAINFPDDRPRSGLKTVSAQTLGPRDTAYQYTGDTRSQITPVRVWNDGRSTFFEFRGNVRPSVFGLNAQGYEITQNSATRGNIVRVDGVRNAYTVRLGEEYVCVRRVRGTYETDPTTVAYLRSKEF